MCLCARIPRVDNRTGIIVLQHPRERFHPFGTARIAALGLSRFSLHVAFGSGLDRRVHHPLELPPGTGLLYPRPDAIDLSHVPEAKRPQHLVVLDGTWSQAHRLYQDNSYLHDLPHYRLNPEHPSRYRIRREPKPHCMSTIESIGLALSKLEPGLSGIDELIGVLDSMADTQIARGPANNRNGRHKKKRQRRLRSVPLSLIDTPERIVLVCGETAPISSRRDPRVRELMQWGAVRLTDSHPCFEAFLQPSVLPLDPSHDAHVLRIGLSRDALADAVNQREVAQRFADFLRPGDVIAAWNQSSLEQAARLGCDFEDAITLKAAYCNLRGGKCGTTNEVMLREGLAPVPVAVSGRAGWRLSKALAIARHLRAQSTK